MSAIWIDSGRPLTSNIRPEAPEIVLARYRSCNASQGKSRITGVFLTKRGGLYLDHLPILDD